MCRAKPDDTDTTEQRHKPNLEAQVSLYRSPDLSLFSVKKCLHDESSAEIDSYKES